MLKIQFTTQFKKDYKRTLKRGLNNSKIEKVIEFLFEEKQLPSSLRDHQLVNCEKYKNVRECHIFPDCLLIYKITKELDILQLIRLGTHSDLF